MRTRYVWTDGACANNGAFENGRYERYGVEPEGAYGVYTSSMGYYGMVPDWMGEHTNNMAELYAIKIALDKAPIGRNTRIVILTDSKLSVNIINEYYFKWINNGAVTNTGQTPANWGLIQDIMDLIFERRDRGQKVRVDYVPGHVGNEGNEKAHNLAQRALREMGRYV